MKPTDPKTIRGILIWSLISSIWLFILLIVMSYRFDIEEVLINTSTMYFTLVISNIISLWILIRLNR
jgi:membrane protein YdbS with pleckstrin-like domain